MLDVIPPPNYRPRPIARAAVRKSPAVQVPPRDFSFVYSRRITRQDGRSSQASVIKHSLTAVDSVLPSSSIAFRPQPSQQPASRELPLDHKVRALTRAIEKARQDLEKEHRKEIFLKRLSFSLIAIILLLATGYVGIDTWLTNNRAKAQLETSAQADAASDSPESEGSDRTPLPANTLANYAVAPALPRALYIDKIDVAARLLPMSVNTSGNIQAPRNIFDAGWYEGSVKPGEIGAMFIDGHSSGETKEGLFGRIGELTKGDLIEIEKGDGSRLKYKVVHRETIELGKVDMKKALLPYGNVLRGLNLMTCAGQWVDGNDGGQTMSERTLIFAEQI